MDRLLIDQVVLGIYGLLLIVGGVIGFLKAGSRPSLIAGTISGLLAWVALGWSTRSTGGLGLGVALALAMVGVFGIRLAKTGKFMPSGMLAVVSGIVLVVLGFSMVG